MWARITSILYSSYSDECNSSGILSRIYTWNLLYSNWLLLYREKRIQVKWFGASFLFYSITITFIFFSTNWYEHIPSAVAGYGLHYSVFEMTWKYAWKAYGVDEMWENKPKIKRIGYLFGINELSNHFSTLKQMQIVNSIFHNFIVSCISVCYFDYFPYLFLRWYVFLFIVRETAASSDPAMNVLRRT